MDPKATFSTEYDLIRGLQGTMFTMSCPHSKGEGYAGGAHHGVGILGTRPRDRITNSECWFIPSMCFHK